WETTKAASANLMRRQVALAEQNPTAALLEAAAVGLIIGVLVQFLLRSAKEDKVDLEHKPSLDEAKYHLGSVLLPFIWPVIKGAKEKYARSVEAAQSVGEKLKDIELPKLPKVEDMEEWCNESSKPVEKWWRKMRELWS